MTRKWLFHVLAASVILAGCVRPPPGAYTDSDFAGIKTVYVATPVAETMRRFHEGFRQCGIEGPGVIVATHYGRDDCAPMRPDGTGVCDLYFGAASGAVTSSVYGRVDFVPRQNGTDATIRTKQHGRTASLFNAYERFMNWSSTSTCPTD